MKIYISADIEGITGITHWDETNKDKADYLRFVEQMTKEVRAACQGAIKAGAKEIWVKDAHDSGRNINPEALPENIRLIRGWSGHPFSMVQELDDTFDAALFIGYHSHSGSSENPLSHTMNPSTVNYIKINDRYVSEFLIHSYAAATVGVPIVFVSGDKGLTKEIKGINENINTLGVNEGIGNSTISIHPNLAVKLVEQEVEKALKGNIGLCKIELPEHFKVEISFVKHTSAYRASFYPGMKQISSTKVSFETNNYFDVLRMIMFIV